MKKIDEKHSIWAEKYRPQCLDDLIMPTQYKENFQEWLNKKEIPHIGVWGNIPGTGKCHEYNEEIEIYVDDDVFDKYFS